MYAIETTVRLTEQERKELKNYADKLKVPVDLAALELINQTPYSYQEKRSGKSSPVTIRVDHEKMGKLKMNNIKTSEALRIAMRYHRRRKELVRYGAMK